MRVTIEHKKWKSIEDLVLFDVPWYIAYPHNGKNGDNPHFHIFVGDPNPNFTQKLRDRMKKLSLKGNKYIAIKTCKNGLLKAIQYGSKENTSPILKGEHAEKWIQDAPPWIPGGVGKKRKVACLTKVDEDGEEFFVGPTLNMYNIVVYAWNYAKRHKLDDQDFEVVLRDMVASGRYNWNFREPLDPYHKLDYQARQTGVYCTKFARELLKDIKVPLLENEPTEPPAPASSCVPPTRARGQG